MTMLNKNFKCRKRENEKKEDKGREIFKESFKLTESVLKGK